MYKRYFLYVCMIFLLLPLPAQTRLRLAIPAFEVSGELSENVGKEVAEILTSELLALGNNNPFQLVERLQITKVIAESFSNLPAVVESSELIKLQEIIQSADILLLGHITKGEKSYLGTYRIIEMKTGDIKRSNAQIVEGKDYKQVARRISVILQKDFADICSMSASVKNLALHIVHDMNYIQQKAGGKGEYKVAVFPFADVFDERSLAIANLSQIVQTELTNTLSRMLEKNPAFTIYFPGQLEDIFAEKRATPLGISCKNPARSIKILRELNLGIDMCVVGRFHLSSSGENLAMYGDLNTWTSLEANLLFVPQGKVFSYDGAMHHTEIDHLFDVRKSLPKRFQIDILVQTEKGEAKNIEKDAQGNFWQPLTMETCQNEYDELQGLYLIYLDESHKGKRYKIRVKNFGTPPFKNHPLDKDAIFSVAIFVDGINSVYEKKIDQTLGPMAIHPSIATKWVLTAPNRKIIPCTEGMPRTSFTKIIGGKLENTDGVGHSILEIGGFQSTSDIHKVFVFGTPEDSVAAKNNAFRKVGLISLYFYQEKFPDLNATLSPAGTAEGQEVFNKTFSIIIPVELQPVCAAHIIYRYQNLPLRD